MNKITNLLLSIVAILIIVGLIIWKEQYYDTFHAAMKTTSPFTADIENKILISGNVYPSVEVEVKSSISGILEKLYVEVGKEVHAGDDIARVKLVPSPTQIETIRNNLNAASIEYENTEKDYKRNLQLFENKVIAPADLEKVEKQYALARERYQSAQNQMNILVGGFANTTDISNIVKAPISGTVIELPLEEGASVIERNNFNVGTSLVSIAQMDHFIFKGKVNEMDLVKLHTGMSMTLILNAFADKKINARIEKIHPKGIVEQGMMKYLIEAKFKVVNDSINVRSGYTATAELILESKKYVLCIEEKNIIYQNDSIFVELVRGEKTEKQFIKTGISDGINVEIIEGLTSEDRLKVAE